MSENGLNYNVNQMQMLLNVSRQVAAVDTLDEMLKTSVDIATEQTNSDRGSLFLNDDQTEELYSRYAQGETMREIRMLNNKGIAGHVFISGQGVIIPDAYADERFDQSVDKETGYRTKNILCVPIITAKNEIIGVIQCLNKKEGKYSDEDLSLLSQMATQTAIALHSAQRIESMKHKQEQEMEFLDIVSDITSEIEIDCLLQKVMMEATKMLKADRGTLFLNDEKTNELFSRVAMGDSMGEIRLPNNAGIAGAVFSSGKAVIIPYAYADLRFNPAFDKKTGFFTRSILCVPIVNKNGKTIGVTQVLNKKGGIFTNEDESRLKAFTAQVAISLENAKLFDDVQSMKNYNESMLESMSNGVITWTEDGLIATCNSAGLSILQVSADEIIKKQADDFFSKENAWIMEKSKIISETKETFNLMDVELVCGENSEKISVNLTILPLISGDKEKKQLGTMLMLEDISSEKRMKSTMSRYMDPGLADQLLGGSEEFLGGQSIPATVFFSDIRGFTTLSEELGPQGTVEMLNDYFTIMVDIITKKGGMLDKFIGDAMMAGFGLPVPHEDDVDRGVSAAIECVTELKKFNVERAKLGKKPVNMGIGLNTDTVVAGNIGSPKRMDYTMIGDGVNLAARLESACKQYFAQILISEYTVAKLKGTYRLRNVDLVIVKGKTKPVGVYEVLDYHTEETFPNLMEVVSFFNAGIDHFRNGCWDKGINSFKESISRNPDDKLSQMYIERCEYMKEHPPEGEWDGVWVLKSK